MALDKPALCKCPKCRSGNVDLIERHDHGYSTYGRFWYRVECLECGYFIADREEFNNEALLIYPAGDCIKVWNLYSQPVKDALISELVGALELMKRTYPYNPPCHNWEPQVEAHKAAKAALTKAREASK